MIKEAIDKILALGKVDQIEIDGRKYTTAEIVPVKIPVPSILTVHTLSGIADYVSKKIDALRNDNLTIHVVSPVEVNLLGFFVPDSFYERPQFIRAVFEPPQFRMADYASLESFIIGIQAYFVQNDNTAALLKIIGNIKDESVTHFSDNGITQGVTAKTGISLVEIAAVPNPVTLRPFRTFPEIEQPESLFVFRMRQQEKQPPACGLWEADNKLWKVEAIKSIAAWLQEKLPDIPIIA